LCGVRPAAEQRVIVGERRFDFGISGKGGALGQHQLSCRLALGERPVRDAVFGNQLCRGLRNPRPVLCIPSERVGAVGAAAKLRMSAMSHRAF
jgi:hypothetical protein